MISWFNKELRNCNPGMALADEPGFKSWACVNQAAKKLWYVVRARGQICTPGDNSQAPPNLEGLQLESGQAGGFLSMVAAEDDTVKSTPLLKIETQISKSVHEDKKTPLLHLESSWGRK